MLNYKDTIRLGISGVTTAIDNITPGISYIGTVNTVSKADKTKPHRQIQRIQEVSGQQVIDYPMYITPKDRLYDETFSYIWEDRATLNRQPIGDIF